MGTTNHSLTDQKGPNVSREALFAGQPRHFMHGCLPRMREKERKKDDIKKDINKGRVVCFR